MYLTTGRAKGNKGFTLAELLIVVAIIAVLVAIAVPIFGGQTEKAREAYDIHVMRSAASLALEKYYEGAASKEGAPKAGLVWWENHGKDANAAGVYDPAAGKFLPKKSGDIKKGYGKGTAKSTGTTYTYGDREIYAPNLDYTKGFVMIAIYPYEHDGVEPHIDVYWKQVGSSDYIGGKTKVNGRDVANDPKYSIRIPIHE